MKFAFIHNGKAVIVEREPTDFLEDFVFKGTYISTHLSKDKSINDLKYEAREANYNRIYNKKGTQGFDF